MAHEALVIASLCGAIAWRSFDDDRPIFGVIWAVLCAGWATVGIQRSLG